MPKTTLKDLTTKIILDDITDNRKKHFDIPWLNDLMLMWLGWFFLSAIALTWGFVSKSPGIFFISFSMFAIWVFLTGIYFIWENIHRIRFIRFKKWTQIKDKPFSVSHVPNLEKDDT